MNFKTLNICQVSLARDIPLILKNFENFKKFYKTIKIYIICSRKEMEEFKKKNKFYRISVRSRRRSYFL